MSASLYIRLQEGIRAFEDTGDLKPALKAELEKIALEKLAMVSTQDFVYATFAGDRVRGRNPDPPPCLVCGVPMGDGRSCFLNEDASNIAHRFTDARIPVPEIGDTYDSREDAENARDAILKHIPAYDDWVSCEDVEIRIVEHTGDVRVWYELELG